MGYVVQVESRESTALAAVRRRASQSQLSTVVPEALGAVWADLRARGVAGTGRNVVLYLDTEINLEAGVEVDAAFTATAGVLRSTTPAGTVATTVHLGPYDRLHEAHAAIRGWCSSHGHALAGPSWEVYGHWKSEWESDSAQIRTEVVYLLESATRLPTTGST